MVLHLLYGQHQVEDCLALVSAQDTLLVMDSNVLELIGDSLSSVPCDVKVLDESAAKGAYNGDATVIDTAGWIELLSQHPHSMSWT